MYQPINHHANKLLSFSLYVLVLQKNKKKSCGPTKTKNQHTTKKTKQTKIHLIVPSC